MKYTKEEELFNSKFINPLVYIFKSHINNSQFVLTEFLSQNPLRVKSIDSSNDYNSIINKGFLYASKNGYKFIDNEIFVPNLI